MFIVLTILTIPIILKSKLSIEIKDKYYVIIVSSEVMTTEKLLSMS